MGIGIGIATQTGSKLGSPKYGPNLIYNGDFSNGGDGWLEVGVTTDYTGEIANLVGYISGDRIYRNDIPVEVGATYICTADTEIITFDEPRIIITSSAGVYTQLYLDNASGWNSQELTFIPTAPDTRIWLRVNAGEVNFDNIVIRKKNY